MESTFNSVFEQVQGWYIGYAQELPGANVQERTLEEAHESLRTEFAQLPHQMDQFFCSLVQRFNRQATFSSL